MENNELTYLMSGLPSDILLMIITKYSNHFRIEKKNGKIKLIPQIHSLKKEVIEKLYQNIEMPIFSISGILIENPTIILKVYIPIKDISNVDEIEYHHEYGGYKIIEPGNVKKYYVIIKQYKYYLDGYNMNTLHLECYSTNLIKTPLGYFVPILVDNEYKNSCAYSHSLKIIPCV
jgi:hypothetical protein